MRYLAHKTEDGREQTALEHLEGTAALAEEFAGVFGAGELARQAGLAHDIGKFTGAFQRRLDGGPIVDHSTAGAIELARRGMPLAACAVAGHHAGLPNVGNPGSDREGAPTLYGRMKQGLAGHIPDYSAWSEALALTPASPPPFCGTDSFTDAFFTRMLYSCLVDADFLDTEEFMCGPQPRGGGAALPQLWERLLPRIADWLENREGDTLNGRRSAILRACLAGAEEPSPLRTLTVPTGGGKTIASLTYALAHGARFGKSRVIYVIPYTSIIEQTAEEFRRRLGDNAVLEHHSGVNYETGEGATDGEYRKALAAENWDAPVVVTTAVQFFESLYAGRSSRCRKLHSIANSVVIFDEAQMLPLPYLRPCVAAIAQLVRHYGVTAVLCTATQPALDPFFQEYAPRLPIRELVPDTQALYEAFRRVTLEWTGPLPDQELVRQLNGLAQVLCIVNSRAHAQELYARLEGEGSFHLSTLMYPAHRRAILKTVRERLANGLPCRVVSTSLIEAGVDVDFPAVYRAEAGLDSILQAAGRCNREGKRPKEERTVTIFRPEKSPPPLFAAQIAATREVMKQFADLASPGAVTSYFQTLRAFQGGAALDQKGILDAFARGIDGGSFPFAAVAERFHLIETAAQMVYVPMEDGAQLVERLRQGERSRGLFRALGQYGVSIYPNHFKALLEAGDVVMLDTQAAILENAVLYHTDTGLSLTADEGKGLFI